MTRALCSGVSASRGLAGRPFPVSVWKTFVYQPSSLSTCLIYLSDIERNIYGQSNFSFFFLLLLSHVSFLTDSISGVILLYIFCSISSPSCTGSASPSAPLAGLRFALRRCARLPSLTFLTRRRVVDPRARGLLASFDMIIMRDYTHLSASLCTRRPPRL